MQTTYPRPMAEVFLEQYRELALRQNLSLGILLEAENFYQLSII